MKLKMLIGGAVMALTMATLGASAANAATTLTYSGNNFDVVTGVYNHSDNVDLTITLASALGANFFGFVTPTSFSATDGVQTITAPNAGDIFGFATNSIGKIVGWDVIIDGSGFANIKSLAGFFGAGDSGADSKGFGFNVLSPGTWTSVTTAVPEPAAWALMLLGFGGLGVMLRRRRTTASLTA